MFLNEKTSSPVHRTSRSQAVPHPSVAPYPLATLQDLPPTPFVGVTLAAKPNARKISAGLQNRMSLCAGVPNREARGVY